MENVTPVTNEDALLVASAREGDSLAFALLVHRYSRVMNSFIGTLSVSESEKEDLLQEGLIGLLKAVRSYEEEKAMFSTYAVTCIKNSIVSALRRYNKSAALYPSLQELEEAEAQEAESPELIYLDTESGRLLHDRLFKALSPLESKVFELYLADETYAEIGRKLGKDVKSVDNAVQRIRSKLKRII